MALGFFIDNKNCYGCKTCSMSCIVSNLPGNRTTFLRRVQEIRMDQPRAVSFLSLACNHCEHPACVKNCPQGAYEKLENGIVKQDHDKCIGCRTCIEACPYGAPAYDEESRSVYKCDMCSSRLERGEAPACVVACPGANIAQGDLDDLRKLHEGAVQEIAGLTLSASETLPSFLIALDPSLGG